MQKHIRLLKIRTVASMITFAAFVIVGGVFAMQGLTAHQPTPLVILLIAGYLLLPRRTVPRGYEPKTPEDTRHVELLDEWRKKFVWIRLVYFGLAIAVLVIFPNIF
ncbi:MAG: hypothetical protein ACNA8W_04505 [Bradymonadaceae bacterium]